MSDDDDDDDDIGGGEFAASDLVLIAYGRDDDDRADYIDRIEMALDEMGVEYERDDDNMIRCELTTDALSQLDEIAGWTGDPAAGCSVQAGVIDDEGDFIPISHAWETWEELLDDVEENIADYLQKYGEDS